jgi:protease-4
MKNRFGGCFTVGVSLLLVISLFLNLIFIVALGSRHSVKTVKEKSFHEELIDGETSDSDKIAVIDLTGVISSRIDGQSGDSMVEDIVAKLKQAREEDDVKAIIVRIDSPGGEVNASDILYHEVAKVRDTAKKPVVIYMESVAASGGFYTAMGGSYIMASDLTITASIGVILQTINYKDLFTKVGLKSVTFKSGKMKDVLNPARDITPEEEQYIQSLIGETYEKFVGIVAKERHLDLQTLKDGIADGRIVSGKQAVEAKLVDKLGYFEDAIKKAKDLAGLKTAQVVRYNVPFSFSKFFKLLGKSPVSSIKVQVGPEAMGLESGKLYYISTHLFSGL